MSRIVAIGDEVEVSGFALAGVGVLPASTDGEVRTAWQELPGDVAVVILTVAAAGALAGELPVDRPLTVVLPC
ncbi:vacuolar-type H+-ATPase subunit F/Vma7 [Amycolatopsis lexingtonensis]|uniref:Vacuolar-type H+-ATPase subunit F/Vma7 n=1 Tax=Amycolatopsis lexingtonensis TaxID=218822 RepID=A0ABR9HSW5_9PSEU|nr:V-type ATP synthase subunit F [Amycolatopsis lexingtonensis]MBE1494019.1 vacuolar-type H+-ATPase subunit F/Vma7 [Amycolatopsis lexingtonensis]